MHTYFFLCFISIRLPAHLCLYPMFYMCFVLVSRLPEHHCVYTIFYMCFLLVSRLPAHLYVYPMVYMCFVLFVSRLPVHLCVYLFWSCTVIPVPADGTSLLSVTKSPSSLSLLLQGYQTRRWTTAYL